LKDTVGVAAFVNADVIAKGLAGFRPEAVSVEAGRIMLKRLVALADAREDFAFESTLSGRSVLRLFARVAARGYDVHLFYLWLPSPELAVARVKHRVALGGHDVAEDVVRRRHGRSLRHAGRLLDGGEVTTWRVYDASAMGPPRVVAFGAGHDRRIVDAERWAAILAQMGEEA
jgi:predicted ABC-type ATPase